jgi:uncharacterized membrane protein HdeD (DUF308 family)
MPERLERELAGKLSRIGVIRGVAALAVGGYVLSQSALSPAVVARSSAAYWLVDGLLGLWAAAFAARLALNRMLLLVRGGVAVVAALTLFGLPLGMVFGQWQPGQVMLLVFVSAGMMSVVGAQLLAAVVDVMMCRAVRRRIPGEWSCAIGTVLSVGLAVIAAATLAVPAPLLGRALGIGAVVGGLGLLATSARLRGGAERSSFPAYSNKP